MPSIGFERIVSIVGAFSGKDGEPDDDDQQYILKAMWIMMLSEFEGSVKDAVEEYIDHVKTKNINDIHICLLMQNFYPDAGEEGVKINNLISVYKKSPSEITYGRFTKDYKAKYKSASIEKLFNTLGVFLTEDELLCLRKIDGYASTRDSIAHGDIDVQITKKEIVSTLEELRNLFSLLSGRIPVPQSTVNTT